MMLAADDYKGNHARQALPPGLYSDVIAHFLHFDEPQPNQLYIIGGRNQQEGPLKSMEMFDTWHGRWVMGPNMSARRAGCDAATLPDHRILCVGGYDERGIVKGLLASCETFDPRTQEWSSEVAPLEFPRWGHGCASMHGLVYAVGGCSLQPGAPAREAFMETLKSCEVYDPKTDQWSRTGDLHMARAGTRVVVVGDRYLAAVGGCDDVFGRAEIISTVELYDPSLGRWSLLDMHLSAPRTTAGVTTLADSQILVIGGAPSLSSSEVFDAASAIRQVAANSSEEPETQQTNQSSQHSLTDRDVADIAEGRMGCQAVALQLPPPGGCFPVCTRTYAVVVGGESGEEELWDSAHQRPAQVRQFSSLLAYDTEDNSWAPDGLLPETSLPRTAMAVVVGRGQIRGHPLYSQRSRPRGGC